MIKQIMLTHRGWWFLYFSDAGTVCWRGPYRRRWQAVIMGWLCRR